MIRFFFILQLYTGYDVQYVQIYTIIVGYLYSCLGHNTYNILLRKIIFEGLKKGAEKMQKIFKK